MKIASEQIHLKDGTTVLLRSPEAQDGEAIVNHLRKVYGETQFMNRVPQEISRLPADKEAGYFAALDASASAFILAAFYQNEVIGLIGVTSQTAVKSQHRCAIGISVAKLFWNRGLGSALMEHAILYAKRSGLEQMELDVVTTNTRAIALYEKFGFKNTGIIPHAHKLSDGSYSDFYYMVKFL